MTKAVTTTLLPTGTTSPVRSSSFVPRLSFTQGVLLGQLSMVILAVLFLRYVVFEDPDAAKRERDRQGETDSAPQGARGSDLSRRKKRKRMRSSSSPATENLKSTLSNAASIESATSILNSLNYDLSCHSPESLDWLNILIAQLLSSYRLLAKNHLAGGARGLMEEALNKKVRPTPSTEADDGSSAGLVGLDEIEVEEVELGEGFPQLSDARVRPSGNEGEGLRVELDLDYTDKVSLSLSTRVVMNFPRPRFAVLPVSLSLTLQRFSGTVTVELPTPSVAAASSPSSVPGSLSHDATMSATPPPPPPHQHPSIHLSLHPDFTLELSTSSLLGSRAKLEDVPKVEQLLNARIRSIIQDRVVWPGRVEISLPGIHSHHSNNRKHSSSGTGTGEDNELGRTVGEESVDDWTVVDRPHPLACENENLPPSFSVSDFKHRNADSDTETETEEDQPHSTTLPRRRPFPRYGSQQNSTDLLNRFDSSNRSTPSAETPSVHFSDPSGPTISLHPKIRKQSQSHTLPPQTTPLDHSSSSASKLKPLLGSLATAATAEPNSNRIQSELNLENLRYFDATRGGAGGGGGGGGGETGTGIEGGRARVDSHVGEGGGGRHSGVRQRLAQHEPPSSPTESFPGYFPAMTTTTSASTTRNGGTGRTGLGTAVGFNSTGVTTPRYRGGLGGVGLSKR